MQKSLLFSALIVAIVAQDSFHTGSQGERVCKDNDANACRAWTTSNPSYCDRREGLGNPYIKSACRWSCGFCGDLPAKYDLRKMPDELKELSFLLGRWRSEHGGKAQFPTIPKFTYGEQLDFSVSDIPTYGAKSINYTSHAWGVNNNEELHSEHGFLAIRDRTNDVALTTVMNNGFTTVEEGRVTSGHKVRLVLQDIGRISFSRDLPVHGLIRIWKLLDENTLEATLQMETLTHPLQEHTKIRYNKIYP